MKRMLSHRETATGFTLIELMIVVAIVAILTAIAVPTYMDYVTRGKLTEAQNGLSAFRVSMEQYYQDNRAYTDTSGACGVAPAASSYKNFTLTCVPAAGGYTATLAGKASSGATVSQFAYTITDTNVRATTAVAPGWGPTQTTCWVVRKGGLCQ